MSRGVNIAFSKFEFKQIMKQIIHLDMTSSLHVVFFNKCSLLDTLTVALGHMTSINPFHMYHINIVAVLQVQILQIPQPNAELAGVFTCSLKVFVI